MAGHNKWSKVKHIKAKEDVKKGKAFSKVGRDITLAVRQGGDNSDMNPALRLALQKARHVNMPKDNITRAIQKGMGGGDQDKWESVLYEAYASGGVAMLIDAITDNRNRTAPNIRMILSKFGAQLANAGTVQYLFDKKGVVLFDDACDSEYVMDIAINAGADDVLIHDEGSVEVVTSTQAFESVVTAFMDKDIPYLSADLDMIPQTQSYLEKPESDRLMGLVVALEADDDVQAVFHNADISND